MLCFPIAAPTLTSSISPQISTILDVPPFNVFNMRCSSIAPESVVTVKTIQWEEEGTIIGDNGISVLISYVNTSIPESYSDLTISGLSVGRHTYSCIATLPVPNANNLSVRATGVVIVNGKCCLQKFKIIRTYTSIKICISCIRSCIAYCTNKHCCCQNNSLLSSYHMASACFGIHPGVIQHQLWPH